jgi:hypothetical protein
MSGEGESRAIACPECGTQIDVKDILYRQVEDELRKAFNKQLADEKRKYEAQGKILEEQRQSVENERTRLQESIQDGIAKRLAAEKNALKDQIRKEIVAEKTDELRAMQDELNKKSEQVKELNFTKAKILQLEREKSEAKVEAELKAATEFSEKLKLEKERIQLAADARVELKLKEKENVIDDLNGRLQEAQRKAEEGSSRLQGEAQELAIEEWLRKAFPLDTIAEIKKGARGGDCLHIVNSITRQSCGSIYYESKRTKDFQPKWIEKFKEDMLAKRANIGVIVTEAMPGDMQRMGLKDGVWVCSFEEFKGLCTVLRESVIQINSTIVAQENKGEKMSMLYDYLTSSEFKLAIEAIVEGFAQMQTDLNSEKRAMESAWKKREKQIEKVLLSTNHMYSSFKGIAGSAIPNVSQLELKQGNLLTENEA